MQQWIIVTILPDKALAPQVCKENTAQGGMLRDNKYSTRQS